MSAVRAWTAADAAAALVAPVATDDKYARGVLGVATGSERYPGAAVIGVDAAIRAGIGMVRYDGPATVGALVLTRRPEAVVGAGRAGAWVVGSGMDADEANARMRSAAWADAASESILVLDAGAIGAAAPGRPNIVTPHAGELAALLGVERTAVLADPVGHAAEAAGRLDALVLLKGATTHVVGAGEPIAVAEATPWLATAGAGDSLAGVLGAFVAARAARGPLDRRDLAAIAATAAFVHGRAARIAAGCRPDGSGGGPFAVLDLNARIAEVVRALLS